MKNISQLEETNRKFKTRLPYSILLTIPASFVLPYLTFIKSKEESLFGNMEYSHQVIIYLSGLLILLIGSYFIITSKNKKLISTYRNRIKDLDD